MGLGEYERANLKYGDSQPTATARYSYNCETYMLNKDYVPFFLEVMSCSNP
jgi:hypothetical protein